METRVLLFDIDATLLRAGNAGTRALNRTFEELYGVRGAMDPVRPHGKTDPLIFREILSAARPDIDPDPEFPRIAGVYLGYLEEELQNSPLFRLMPGVRELLAALSQVPGLALGLATGNLEEGAKLKLQRGGLDGYFSFGGFGSDAEDRTELVRTAVRRAEVYLGAPVPLSCVYVIGDTPRDILHGKAAGALTVGVATGACDVSELSRHGPDFVFEDFSNTNGMVEFFQPSRITGGAGEA